MRLALPVVLSQLSQTVVGIVDTMMVGRISVEALAAVGLSGLVCWMVLGSLSHLAMGTQILTARRTGAKSTSEVGQVLQSALRLAVLPGIPLTLILWYVTPFLYHIILGGDTSELNTLCITYTRWRLLGITPFLLISAFKGFFNGIGDTKQHMRVSIIINLLNILFNWLLIFGHAGFPAIGAPGAGMASAIATACGCLFFLYFAHREEIGNRFGVQLLSLFGRTHSLKVFAPNGMRAILRLSWPSATQNFFVMCGFACFLSFMKSAGTPSLAAANVVITILSFSFMPGFGIGIAANTLIGQLLGAGSKNDALLAGREAQKVGALLMSLVGVCFLLFPDQLLSWFTSDAEVIALGRWPLRLLGAFQAFDAWCMTTAGCLEGAGLTLFVMKAELAINWLYFIPASYIVIHLLEGGIRGAFLCMAAYLVFYALVLELRFRKGDWLHRIV